MTGGTHNSTVVGKVFVIVLTKAGAGCIHLYAGTEEIRKKILHHQNQLSDADFMQKCSMEVFD